METSSSHTTHAPSTLCPTGQEPTEAGLSSRQQQSLCFENANLATFLFGKAQRKTSAVQFCSAHRSFIVKEILRGNIEKNFKQFNRIFF